MKPCVHPLRVEFLFPPVLWNSCNQSLLAIKARFYGGSSSCCQISRLGILTWCSELSILWENFCGIIIFLFVGHPLNVYGIWVYCDCAPLPSCCGFFLVFGCRVSFLVGSSIFLLMVVHQLVVILAFLVEEVSSCPSTLPSCLLPPALIFVVVAVAVSTEFILINTRRWDESCSA